jgi:predicted O-methyltransferase YrrM
VDLSPYLDKLGIRAQGFRIIFERLRSKFQANGPLTLVETGCVRHLDNWQGDGNSTILFAEFAKRTGSIFYTIDINPAHCKLARQICPTATVLCGDSVEVLYGLRFLLTQIDFLYLDSFDVDWQNAFPSALHHLKEFCAAAPLLHSGALIVVDDNVNGVGKGMYISDFMKSVKANLFLNDYQLGFVLG